MQTSSTEVAGGRYREICLKTVGHLKLCLLSCLLKEQLKSSLLLIFSDLSLLGSPLPSNIHFNLCVNLQNTGTEKECLQREASDAAMNIVSVFYLCHQYSREAFGIHKRALVSSEGRFYISKLTRIYYVTVREMI